MQNEAFIFYSGFTEAHLLVPAGFLLESIAAPGFEDRFVYRKYSTKSEPHLVPGACLSRLTCSCPAEFLKASIFARNWAKQNAALESES